MTQITLLRRDRWTRQPRVYPGLDRSLSKIAHHVLLPTAPVGSLVALSGSSAPPMDFFGRGRSYSFDPAGPRTLSDTAKWSTYPITFVGVLRWPDVTTAMIATTFGSVAGGANWIQLDTFGGSARFIVVGSSTRTVSAAVSANRWCNVVGVAASSTDRRIYLDGQLIQSDTVSSTLSGTFTRVAYGCGCNGTFPNGATYSSVKASLMAWLNIALTDKAARDLSLNPWSMFRPREMPVTLVSAAPGTFQAAWAAASTVTLGAGHA